MLHFYLPALVIIKGGQMKKFLSLLLVTASLLSLMIFPAGAANETKYSAGQVFTTQGRLNVRSAPSASAYIKTSLEKGSLVTIISENSDFFYVRYNENSYGYCHKNYIKITSDTNATVNVSWGNLNVRTGPSTNYSVKDKLPKGEKVIVLSSKNGFSEILYNGNETGFVSSTYLKISTSAYKSVKLSVPSFKQTDPRWANKLIGTSGKTIGKIGCATTSIAMIESFRQGCTIYPDTMSKQLSYSSTGNVYWPSHYKVTTNSTDYLKQFYNILSQGKPVLFGAKTYNGSQHWVVITGFSGEEITASNFTINDPGSNQRTTLDQFIAAYPVFYKYFSY